MNRKNLLLQKGFTLIELLIVVVVIGILAGIMISVIDPARQRAIAEDGVKMSNVEKLALSIESYAAGEGRYPAASSAAPDPASANLDIYLKSWPTSPGIYVFNSDPANNTFEVTVQRSADTARCYKYHSSWGAIMDCAYNVTTSTCYQGSDQTQCNKTT